MEPKSSLRYSRQSTISPCSKPYDYIPPSHFVTLIFIFKISFHLRLDFKSSVFPSRVQIKILNEFLIFPA
jgi:hypothetical protein